ncbi:MAG: AbrB/MazE/SpoVT family DNA-binding domain-containing protein [Betaproteobacteria bacterium]|nr:AbrB/MazE/SpoVT family DNA-binding domain-containing protein [Betaproteobacteria bacterium]
MATTKRSSKGQVVLPSAARLARRWKAGTKLAVDNRPERDPLRPAKPFAETSLADVVGSAGYKGPRKTLRDMEDAVLRGGHKRN